MELLDYPGDRIDFYEGASVGRLSQSLAYDGVTRRLALE